MLLVWDLHPEIGPSTRSTSRDDSRTPPPAPRPQPTAFVTPFSHPLTSVSSHPASSSNLLISDCRGSVYLVDWRSDPVEEIINKHNSTVELLAPWALSDAVGGSAIRCSTAWRPDDPDMYVSSVSFHASVGTTNFESASVAFSAKTSLVGTFRSSRAASPASVDQVSQKAVVIFDGVKLIRTTLPYQLSSPHMVR